MTTFDDAKAMAKRLRSALAATGQSVTHSQSLELVAHQLGHRDWNSCNAALSAEVGESSAPLQIPILRTFPGEQARDFYCGYLGFTVDWEHRFAPDLPLYQQVSRGGCVLHLSEHHGDATPGSAIRIAVTDIDKLHRQLHATSYPLRPGIEREPWGADMVVPDPFGNRVIFHQPSGAAGAAMTVEDLPGLE